MSKMKTSSPKSGAHPYLDGDEEEEDGQWMFRKNST